MLDFAHCPDDIPTALRQAEDQLLAPGSPFELETVQTESGELQMFAQRPRTLRDIVLRSRELGDREAIVYDNDTDRRRLTYAQLHEEIARCATILAADYKLQKGDRVAIWAENRIEWLTTFWAVTALGGIAVGLNAWWTPHELQAALAATEPKLLVSDAKRLANQQMSGAFPVVDMDADLPGLLAAIANPALPDADIAETDPAVILFTSGTTGQAKPIVQTHRNICSLMMCNFFHGARLGVAAAIEAGTAPPSEPPQAHVLVTSPLFHVSGLHNAAVTCMASGAKAIWYGGKFEGKRALKLIQDENVTSWGYTETLLKRLLDAMEATGQSADSFSILGGGGSPIAPALQDRARKHIPGIAGTFGVGYGQTECGSLATLNPGKELAAHPESVGRPLPTITVDIRDPEGASLADGEEGEIYVRSPMVTPGVWNDAEQTNEILDSSGWLKTGDWGYIDGGRLYIASRKRDLILRGGENIYPVEIERCLDAHPAVVEVAVVGVDSEAYGQEVKAFVVVDADEAVAEADLLAHCKDRLAYFKVPSAWSLRSEPLPRNALGKVQKHLLSQG